MAATLLQPETLSTVARKPAQTAWAAMPIKQRLQILRRARHELARISDRLVDAISPGLHRTRADSYGSEVLPLLAACRFLEQDAARILKPRRLGIRRRPLWLARIDSTVERVPFGVVLIIAPANYPLLLAGVQTLQALAAGNAVVWKPGRDSVAVAQVFAAAMARVGLPDGLLEITDESTETAIAQLQAGPDKVFFTGSGAAGRAVLRMAAEQAIPVVAELSGCDAVIVLPSADASRVAGALTWGMRLNGSSTCIAPRRLILVGDGHEKLIELLLEQFAATPGVELSATTRDLLGRLVADARHQGGTVFGNLDAGAGQPLLVLNARPEMLIAQADIFAPVLTVLHAPTLEDVSRIDSLCPFGLTAAIFGEERTARLLGARLNVGSVLINDIIFPTVDPRVPFGGRRGSGFGTTRGAEGLLEMTAARVTAVSKDKLGLHHQSTGPAHEKLFRAAVAFAHSPTLRQRFTGLRNLVAAARKLGGS